ncbi:phosphotransferase family protein [Actinomarinicola tropica]|uniref:Phosphotransferase n=1 Tax=Actinomarinicola tropica TaxID=2789776 RepID=A0A5Q2RSK6_9ACTN|nr:aminoglycoside phosphotransferase family protein [Actinomarinicola tropica]QGG96185.1 phosphotransferase [Actinomarinicola tropica]
MDDREAHLRRLRAAPPTDGLARMAEALGGPGTRVERVRRLRGGLACATHAVRLSDGRDLVVKRSLAGARSLRMEHQALVVAEGCAVTTPDPVALDDAGAWFGRPALVMTRVPGRADLHDGRRGAWIGDLAEAMAAVHATPLPDPLPDALARRHAWESWGSPRGEHLRPTPLVERALVVAAQLRTDLAADPPATALVHHDLHPGNATWRRGRLVGLVDWAEARRGPAVADVAYCAVDLATSHGERAADDLVAAYRSVTGDPLDDLDRWRVLWTLNAMRWIPWWQAGYAELGLAHVPMATLRRRLRRTLARQVAAVGP